MGQSDISDIKFLTKGFTQTSAHVIARPYSTHLFSAVASISNRHGYPSYKICHRCHRSHLPEKSLTHTDEVTGKAKMVDVGSKPISTRMAKAQARVKIGEELTDLILQNGLKKGDVLSVARLAGTVAAKQTSSLIPLCHNIPLSVVNVDAVLCTDTHCVTITATVRCEGRTGVEMEALTAASVAALTVYDMCKAVSHDIVISDIMLLEKTGGTRGEFRRL